MIRVEATRRLGEFCWLWHLPIRVLQFATQLYAMARLRWLTTPCAYVLLLAACFIVQVSREHDVDDGIDQR
jgi:hypothetical protein